MVSLVPLQHTVCAARLEKSFCLPYSVSHLRHDRIPGPLLPVSKAQVDPPAPDRLLFQEGIKAGKPDRR